MGIKKVIEDISRIETMLLEMANIQNDAHGLKYDITFHIHQPGLDSNGAPVDNSVTHPRVKVFKRTQDDGFTVPLNGKRKIKGDWKNIVKKISDYNEIVGHIQNNGDAYLLFYCSPDMGQKTLKEYLLDPTKAKKDLKKLLDDNYKDLDWYER